MRRDCSTCKYASLLSAQYPCNECEYGVDEAIGNNYELDPVFAEEIDEEEF